MKLNKVFLVSALLSSGVYAEDLTDIEKLTVSSSFRQQDIQNVTASITLLSQQELQARQAQHLEDVLNLASNVNYTSGASRGRFIQIRGIGERSQYAEPINPSVGLLIDGFDFSGLAALGTLFDVEQVEILRGPQATEFGAAGMAGTIKIKTTEADSDSQPAILEFSAAQKGTIGLAAAQGGSITDKLFYRVAVNQYSSDGYIQNTYLGRGDTDDIDEFSGKIKLKYYANDRLSMGLNYQYFDIDNGYDAFSLDNDRTTRSDQPGFDKQETHALAVNLDRRFDRFDLYSNINYTRSNIGYAYDEDWTFSGFHPWGYTSFDAYFRDRNSSSLDLRFVSNQQALMFAGTTQWLVGLYGKQSSEALLRQYTYNESDFSSEYEPQNIALYAQTESALTKNVSLEVGLRVDNFKLKYSNNEGFIEDNRDTLVGGKIALDYNMGNAIVYSSVSRGYKAGGFNPDQRVSAENRIFEPEFNWNYELGVKGNLSDYDAFISLAVFYMDRSNTQVNDYDLETREDGSATFIDIIGNADTGTNLGLEFTADWQINSMLSVEASYGYLDATFEGYTLADGSVVEKQQQAQAPKHTFSVVANAQLTDNMDVRIDFEGKDDFRFSDGHDVRRPFTALVNGYINYQLNNWTLSLWSKNLLDKTFYVRGFGGFSNDPRDGYANPIPYYQLGDGRQVGMTARLVY